MAKKYIEPSTAAKETLSLPEKPANGGIPALEKSTVAKVTAANGLALERELESVIDLTDSSFFFIDGSGISEDIGLSLGESELLTVEKLKERGPYGSRRG